MFSGISVITQQAYTYSKLAINTVYNSHKVNNKKDREVNMPIVNGNVIERPSLIANNYCPTDTTGRIHGSYKLIENPR